jgi:hypothetical protein
MAHFTGLTPPTVCIHAGITNCGIMPPPNSVIGMSIAQPAPLAACSVRLRPAIIIMKPMKPSEAHTQASTKRLYEVGLIPNTRTPMPSSTPWRRERVTKQASAFPARNCARGGRRHSQAHERSMHAFAHEPDGKAHDAADDAPHDALRKCDVEAVGGADAFTHHRRARDTHRRPRQSRGDIGHDMFGQQTLDPAIECARRAATRQDRTSRQRSGGSLRR